MEEKKPKNFKKLEIEKQFLGVDSKMGYSGIQQLDAMDKINQSKVC